MLVNLASQLECSACRFASHARLNRARHQSLAFSKHVGFRVQRFSIGAARQQQRLSGRPDIYVHETSISGRKALSHIRARPVFADSPTVIGFLSDTGRLDDTAASIRPSAFEDNPEWRPMLHEILSQVCWSDEALQTQAANRIDGYIHIIDERNMPALNRAGEPEDIIGSVLCSDGKLVEGSYQPGDAYRLVTNCGPMQLNDGLSRKLVAALEVARSVEESMARDSVE